MADDGPRACSGLSGLHRIHRLRHGDEALCSTFNGTACDGPMACGRPRFDGGPLDPATSKRGIHIRTGEEASGRHV